MEEGREAHMILQACVLGLINDLAARGVVLEVHDENGLFVAPESRVEESEFEHLGKHQPLILRLLKDGRLRAEHCSCGRPLFAVDGVSTCPECHVTVRHVQGVQ